MQITSKLISGLPDPYCEVNFLKRVSGWQMSLHSHHHYQLILVIEGCMHLFCKQDYSILPGHLVIIPPHEHHALYTTDGFYQFGINFGGEKDKREIILLLQTYVGNALFFKENCSFDPVYKLLSKQPHLSLVSKIKIASLLDNMLLDYIEDTTKNSDSLSKKLLDILYRHIYDKAVLQNVSDELYISKTQLERISNRTFGCGVITLFNCLKLNRAYEMLLENNKNLQQISEKMGFYDQAHFSRFFKKKTGMTPFEYRKKHAE